MKTRKRIIKQGVADGSILAKLNYHLDYIQVDPSRIMVINCMMNGKLKR